MSQDTIKKVLTTSSLAVATLVGVNAKVSAQEVPVDGGGKSELVSVSETTDVKPEVKSSEVISEVISEPLELAKEAPKDDNTSSVAKGEVTRSDEDGELTTGGSVLKKEAEELGSRQTFNDGNDFHKVSITQSPYNSTVYIQNKIGSGENVSTGFGTGVFVSDNVFVTAAHNFYDPKTKELLKGEFYYYTGTDGVDHEGKRYRIDPSQIQRLTDASGFESVSKTDLVAVKTNEVLSLVNPVATPAKVSEKASSADNVSVVGYPGSLPSKNIKRGELHASVGDVNTSRYRSGMFVYQNDTLPGMSGAPIFNSDNELVGLHLGTVTWADNKEMSNVGLKLDGERLDFVKKVINDNNLFGWKTYDGKLVYFKNDGKMARNERLNVGDKLYYFGNDGRPVAEYQNDSHNFTGRVFTDVKDLEGHWIQGGKRTLVRDFKLPAESGSSGLTYSELAPTYNIQAPTIPGYQFVGFEDGTQVSVAGKVPYGDHYVTLKYEKVDSPSAVETGTVVVRYIEKNTNLDKITNDAPRTLSNPHLFANLPQGTHFNAESLKQTIPNYRFVGYGDSQSEFDVSGDNHVVTMVYEPIAPKPAVVKFKLVDITRDENDPEREIDTVVQELKVGSSGSYSNLVGKTHSDLLESGIYKLVEDKTFTVDKQEMTVNVNYARNEFETTFRHVNDETGEVFKEEVVRQFFGNNVRPTDFSDEEHRLIDKTLIRDYIVSPNHRYHELRYKVVEPAYKQEVHKTMTIPYQVNIMVDNSKPLEYRQLKTVGQDGVSEVTYYEFVENGLVVHRELASDKTSVVRQERRHGELVVGGMASREIPYESSEQVDTESKVVLADLMDNEGRIIATADLTKVRKGQYVTPVVSENGKKIRLVVSDSATDKSSVLIGDKHLILSVTPKDKDLTIEPHDLTITKVTKEQPVIEEVPYNTIRKEVKDVFEGERVVTEGVVGRILKTKVNPKGIVEVQKQDKVVEVSVKRTEIFVRPDRDMREDDTLPVGTVKVIQDGKNGKVVVYHYTDGRGDVEEVIEEQVPQIVLIGIKKVAETEVPTPELPHRNDDAPVRVEPTPPKLVVDEKPQIDKENPVVEEKPEQPVEVEKPKSDAVEPPVVNVVVGALGVDVNQGPKLPETGEVTGIFGVIGLALTSLGALLVGKRDGE